MLFVRQCQTVINIYEEKERVLGQEAGVAAI